MRVSPPYGWTPPVYDLLSFEWPVYRAGRVAGVEALGLRQGDSVVDIGCGTGLTLPLVEEAVGPEGRVVGVDSSGQMLAQARGRVDAGGWTHVDLVEADATDLGGVDGAVGVVDAAIFVYSLSVVKPWQQAWEEVLAIIRPGGRIAVVDMRDPTGAARVLTPLARLACRVGHADIDAHPWTALERDLTDVTRVGLRGGHIQVRAGTVP